MGGTGRSGTTITGQLLGAHPAYHMVPFEAWFLSDPGGLTDLVARRTTIVAFERRLLGPWWDRGDAIGLKTIVDRPTLRALLRELNNGLKADREAAAARFVHRLFDAPALASGASGWIEMTPRVVNGASELLCILGGARLIHSVRDGRDVACSVVPLSWGPDDLDVALDWWAARLDRAFSAVAAAPAERVLTVRMEALVATDRDTQYARLLEFVGLVDDPAMRRFFDAEATPERAHIGRWSSEVPADRLAEFEAHYRRAAEELAARWGYQPEVGVVPSPPAATG